LLKEINSQKTKDMNIAIIGYGRMGHEIESAAVGRGHEINLIVDKDNHDDISQVKARNIDVAIEFTTPDTALANISLCLEMKIPVVCGTTGWLKDYDRAEELCRKNNTSFIHSSNFSIGVNILFRINSELARFMAQHPEYKPFIEEIHHVKKLDAPSGTAIQIAKGIISEDPKYTGWCFEDEEKEGNIPIRSVREGLVPGIHRIIWDSDADALSLRHEAKGRKGLALGAVIAAEYIWNRKGVFTMNDVLGF
jgi:4-hydroxy-tetrahydrodipicolinate reductase